MNKNGVLAKQYLDVSLPLQVLQSNAGFYLGTADDDGPCSRESVEFWPRMSSRNVRSRRPEITFTLILFTLPGMSIPAGDLSRVLINWRRINETQGKDPMVARGR